jgi:hypothetical protein
MNGPIINGMEACTRPTQNIKENKLIEHTF